MLFFIKVSLVHWHIRQNNMQKRWICNRMCHTYFIINLQGGETGNIITLTQFEVGYLLSQTRNLLSKTHDNTESGNESDEDSNKPSLISEEKIDAMSSGDDSDTEPISTEMLEDIRDSSQSHPVINSRYARCKIHDRIRQGQAECKGSLLSTRKMGKGLHKVFRAIVNEIFQVLPILDE